MSRSKSPEELVTLNATRILKKKELEVKYPKRKVGLVAYRDGREFWLLSPTRAAWHSFKDQVMDPRRKKVATENLIASCTVSPTAQELQEMFEIEPLLVETLSEKLSILGGRDDEAELVDFLDA